VRIGLNIPVSKNEIVAPTISDPEKIRSA